eukprot:TRINITY_DN27845_c0_g1_i1.p2 TRINITY_DN27845_c0_g1~~TRINITY_DN27845_c0_g1_i1.p2  ORF type:complete len:332 (+),score=113.17 TRINITY_DN27845_c0_g1_i1:69-1064(+)
MAASLLTVPTPAPRRPRKKSARMSVSVVAPDDDDDDDGEEPMTPMSKAPKTPLLHAAEEAADGKKKAFISYEDFVGDKAEKREMEARHRAWKAGKVVKAFKAAGDRRREVTAGKSAWARLRQKCHAKEHINQQLLRECGVCGRFMLDMDGYGNPYMPDGETGPGGQVPVRCPGCNLCHKKWVQRSLLGEHGIQRENCRREDLAKKQHKGGVWYGGNDGCGGRGAAHKGPSQLQTLLAMSMREAKSKRRDEHASRHEGPRKWTEHPHRYITWCRKIGEDHPCDHRTCKEHHAYHTRRLRDDLTQPAASPPYSAMSSPASPQGLTPSPPPPRL